MAIEIFLVCLCLKCVRGCNHVMIIHFQVEINNNSQILFIIWTSHPHLWCHTYFILLTFISLWINSPSCDNLICILIPNTFSSYSGWGSQIFDDLLRKAPVASRATSWARGNYSQRYSKHLCVSKTKRDRRSKTKCKSKWNAVKCLYFAYKILQDYACLPVLDSYNRSSWCKGRAILVMYANSVSLFTSCACITSPLSILLLIILLVLMWPSDTDGTILLLPLSSLTIATRKVDSLTAASVKTHIKKSN